MAELPSGTVTFLFTDLESSTRLWEEHPDAMRGGLINFTQDSDTVGRHASLYTDRKGWRFPSLPARILAGNVPTPRLLLNHGDRDQSNDGPTVAR